MLLVKIRFAAIKAWSARVRMTAAIKEQNIEKEQANLDIKELLFWENARVSGQRCKTGRALMCEKEWIYKNILSQMSGWTAVTQHRWERIIVIHFNGFFFFFFHIWRVGLRSYLVVQAVYHKHGLAQRGPSALMLFSDPPPGALSWSENNNTSAHLFAQNQARLNYHILRAAGICCGIKLQEGIVCQLLCWQILIWHFWSQPAEPAASLAENLNAGRCEAETTG